MMPYSKMRNKHSSRFMPIAVLTMLIAAVQSGQAGVSKAIQEKYRRDYENKALFLKIPIFSEKQFVYIRGQAVVPDQTASAGSPRYKVGDQMRVLALEFGGDEIRCKLGALSGTGLAEIVFKFDAGLQDTFPNSDMFDKAMQATFTEGLKYSDLEEAKKGYVDDQFDRVVNEMAAASGAPREVVLKNMAPHLPAYQDALREIDNLKARGQELSTQVSQSQSENRKLDAELRSLQAESSRLRSQNQSLQEKIDSSTSQLSRLGDDLRNAKGMTQGYQSAIANLQRSLNLKVDANRDLGSQIADLGQALRRLQKDNETLEAQGGQLRGNLERTQAEKAQLSGDLEDARASNRKLKETIDTLTSKEDSLARQYLDLKRKKENLDNVITSIDNLNTRTLEEKSEGGFASGKVGFYLKDVPLGSLEWRLPDRLSHGEEKAGEVGFNSESIDYVKATAEERFILRSLGDRLKLQVKLASLGPTIEVRTNGDVAQQEVGERDRAVWRYKVFNSGMQDARLALSVHLINKNSDDIPVFQMEQPIASASVVRQVRNYLQPIPVGLGAVIGMLLFSIGSLFRRVKGSRRPPGQTVGARQPPAPVIDKKHL